MPTLAADSRGPVEIYYEEEGSGEPLVMIGGFTVTVEVWGRLRPLLAEKYRVIMPDNRGSVRPGHSGVSLKTLTGIPRGGLTFLIRPETN